jgi:hypothetical protein
MDFDRFPVRDAGLASPSLFLPVSAFFQKRLAGCERQSGAALR